MIHINEKEKCCGCSACANICPKNCILMQEDDEGFLYPVVDKVQCIQCGACEKVCPMLDKEIKIKNNKAYVSYAKQDEIRMNSSSGGVFSLLAELVLENNGIVFGAAFDQNFEVHHIKINNKLYLDKLRGSKYIQSCIEETYKETQKYLRDRKQVLFSGTACQIAGLKRYLKRDYENLFTIDVLCHGTPSPKVWRRYLKEREEEYGSSIDYVFFRQKNSGWKTYSVALHFKNQKYYNCIFYQERFMKLFLADICLRPSCYKCIFKNINRPSDITLGDCWGIENYMPEMDDNKGTSVVITHSDKGETMLKNLKDKLVIKEADLDMVLPPNADSRKSVVEHPKRSEFFEKFNNGHSTYELVKLSNLTFLQKVIKRIKYMYLKFMGN